MSDTITYADLTKLAELLVSDTAEEATLVLEAFLPTLGVAVDYQAEVSDDS